MIIRLLADAKERARNGLESDYPLDYRGKAGASPKLGQGHGASSIIGRILNWRRKPEDTETAFSKLGFSYDEDDYGISLRWKMPAELRQVLEEAKRSAQDERDAELKKYDKAILGVLTAQDAAEAREIAEGLL